MTANKNTATATATTTPNGKPGVVVFCPCKTHKGISGTAIVATPTPADKFPTDRIHGFVTLAHSPMGKMLARKPQADVWAA